MSGGERRKKGGRGTGWEEAGGEFYQESYPGGELDVDGVPRDPHYFATLLPSKQTRSATAKRPRGEGTLKRRTTTRRPNPPPTTMAQNTIPNDIHVAMMPDLSENLANEETTWEEMMLIKAMPVNMAQKKDIKAKLLSADTFRLQGYKQFNWQKRKFWEYIKMHLKETSKKFELWGGCFRSIKGKYGCGVVTFFEFIKWLMLMNLAFSLASATFLILPAVLLEEDDPNPCLVANGTASVDCCSQLYFTNWTNRTIDPFEVGVGGGWLESTLMYYGVYPASTLQDPLFTYNLPLAYLLVALSYLAFSFFVIFKRAIPRFKEKLLESEGQFYKYCNLVFSSWDNCLRFEKSGAIKRRALYLEMKEALDSEKREEDKKNSTRDEHCRLISMRIFLNILVILIYVAVGSLVYLTFQFTLAELEREAADPYTVLLEFTPSLCIVGLHLITPNILNYLVSLERYSPGFSMRLNLVRSVLLRFVSLGALLASLYTLVKCKVEADEGCVSTQCKSPLCWETYVGRQLYKLILVDILSHFVLTFLVNFPRMLMARHIRCKLARLIGSQEFELQRHLLDVTTLQMVVWFGSFFVPLFPAIGALALFLLFYTKKFACLVNSSPSTTLYTVSKSNLMYLFVLLLSFTAALLPWGFMVSEIQPSRACGPFRGRPSFLSLLMDTYSAFPECVRLYSHKLTSPLVCLPLLLALCLLLYYYYFIASSYKEMVEVLKKQLILEGHDKQFLLNRLSAFIKQHQERHKQVRSVEPSPAST